jgi:hypothetical protein
MSEVQLGELERRLQDPRRYRRAHAAQTAGRMVAGLILLAALAGLAGPGPLSRVSASAPLVEVAYERFTRRSGDTSLRLVVRSDPADPATARVWLSAGYLAGLRVRQVVPEPESWTSVRDGVVLAFPAPHGRAEVDVQVRPDHIGPLRGLVGAPGRTPARLWQFVYP